jgi:hypothetical protein
MPTVNSFIAQPRLPVQPLLDYAQRTHGWPTTNVVATARWLGTTPSAVHRWQRDGVPLYNIDDQLVRNCDVLLEEVWTYEEIYAECLSHPMTGAA